MCVCVCVLVYKMVLKNEMYVEGGPGGVYTYMLYCIRSSNSWSKNVFSKPLNYSNSSSDKFNSVNY